MYQTVTLSMFRSEFESIRPNSFSLGGLTALLNYLEELEEGREESYEFKDFKGMELDVIALCDDYSEIDADEFVDDYGSDWDKVIAELENGSFLIWG